MPVSIHSYHGLMEGYHTGLLEVNELGVENNSLMQGHLPTRRNRR